MVAHNMDALAWLRKRLDDSDADLLREMVAESYVADVSTRRVDKLIKTLGIEGISSSQVSVLSKSLDESVEAFRSRPLDAAGYPYV